MGKTFNTDGYCDPKLHYMVNLDTRLREIKSMVDAGKYFTINRARQYGKTTVLTALADYLQTEYEIISLDFQGLSYLTSNRNTALPPHFPDRYFYIQNIYRLKQRKSLSNIQREE